MKYLILLLNIVFLTGFMACSNNPSNHALLLNGLLQSAQQSMPQPRPVPRGSVLSIPQPRPVPQGSVQSRPQPRPIPQRTVRFPQQRNHVPSGSVQSLPQPKPVPQRPTVWIRPLPEKPKTKPAGA